VQYAEKPRQFATRMWLKMKSLKETGAWLDSFCFWTYP